MRFLIRTVFFYLTIASFLGCDKTEEFEYVYAQTYCADVWDNSPVDLIELYDPEQNFESYMNSEAISYSNYTFELENEAEQCEACSCLSGYVFRITASDDLEDELLNLGFTAGE